jgi:enediyne biosynthesis protein E4
MDVLIMNRNEPPSLLRNDAPPAITGSRFAWKGTKSNRSAIGARVLVRYGGKVQAQEVVSQIQLSFRQRSAPALRSGRRRTADIEVHWPSGLVEQIQIAAANQLLTLREGAGQVKGRPFR